MHIVIAQSEHKIKFAVFTIIMQLDIIRLIIQTNEENRYIFLQISAIWEHDPEQNTIVSSAHKFHLESAAKDQISGMELLCIWV